MITEPAGEVLREYFSDARSGSIALTRRSILARAITLAAIAAAEMLRWPVRRLSNLRRPVHGGSGTSGEGLARMCERMGPTFIKFAQLLSSRPDLIGEPVARSLARVRDHVAPVAPDAVVAIIEMSLGAPLERNFSRFERDAVAAGSIAQVHRGWLHSGEAVAVKVRRPGLGVTMARDFALLRSIVSLLERTPWCRSIPLREVVAEIELAVMGQIDFRREVKSNERFRKNLGARPWLVIPEPVPELCTDDVITMEFIADLAPVDALRLSQPQRETVSRAGMEALCDMIFIDGFIHADLHPGNVVVRSDGTIVLLDFGLVAELDRTDRERFREFFLAMATDHGERCAELVIETALALPPALDIPAFTQAMKEMVNRFAGRNIREFEVARFVTELFAVQRRFGIRGATTFMMTIVSLLLFEGILKTLNPLFDFQSTVARFLMALPSRALGPQDRAALFMSMQAEWEMRSGRMPDDAGRAG